MSRSWRWAVLPAGAISTIVITLLILTGSAFGHAHYDHSDPADGASLAAPPARVNVWFEQEVRRSGGLPTLIVVNEAGDIVSLNTVLDDRDRTHVYVDMPPALRPGRYTVIWRTLSDGDGEEAQGAFHYYVGVAASPTPAIIGAAPTPASTPTVMQSTSGDDGDSGVPVWGLVLGVVGGIAVGAGAATGLARRR